MTSPLTALSEADKNLLAVLILCVLILYIFPKLGFARTWRDITTDGKGHVIKKDLFQALAFYVSLFLCVFSAYSDYVNNRPISAEPTVFLLAYSLGAAGLKLYQNFQNRMTATDSGQPLVEPGMSPPKAMPQVDNPNTPPSEQVL